ncbi:sensor histidine kinase [Vallitalea pronyensis]|uniref:histidine kinase n=1 Tax=Vallitalea pronyensis TaxID=1348613 RepID=A0A8J8SF04_9FIRM|nr:sensor histidine kinase [Vallitalea pronyensis]QUI21100.1 sensor histidine kinase [Vallitalea pronyensis]
MYEDIVKKLNRIVDETKEIIKERNKEILEISSYINKKYVELEDKFLVLKDETAEIMQHVEQLENKLSISKTKLLTINKNYKLYTEEEMKSVYKETEDIRKQLSTEYEHEMHIVNKRNSLEKELKAIRQLAEKSDYISSNFDFAYGILSGELNEINNDANTMNSKEIWGLKVIKAQEEERARISREMHDGPSQNLSNLILKTELCIKLLDKDLERTRLELQSLKAIIRTTINETRRMIYNLRPMALDDLGLVPTLERYIDKIRNEVNFNIFFEVLNMEDDVNSIISLTLYRIVQEALNNANKYSNALNVTIKLFYNPEFIELKINDDGDGFDINNVKLNMENNRGFGISMMRERSHLLMGEYKLKSVIGTGTEIYVKIPILESKEDTHE